MSAIFKKLNLKNQPEILVCNAPDSFESELAELNDVNIRRGVEETSEIDFSLAFVMKQKEVDELARAIAQKANDDATVWFAYPKGSSKKYKCEINRDRGWTVMARLASNPSARLPSMPIGQRCVFGGSSTSNR